MKAADRITRRDQLSLIATVMRDPRGRAYFYDLLASCHVYATTFSTDALSMAFREGERNVGIRLGADITEAAPDLYLQMLKEAGNVRSKPDPEPRRDDDFDPADGLQPDS